MVSKGSDATGPLDKVIETLSPRQKVICLELAVFPLGHIAAIASRDEGVPPWAREGWRAREAVAHSLERVGETELPTDEEVFELAPIALRVRTKINAEEALK